MTNNVFGGTLNLNQSIAINQPFLSRIHLLCSKLKNFMQVKRVIKNWIGKNSGIVRNMLDIMTARDRRLNCYKLTYMLSSAFI